MPQVMPMNTHIEPQNLFTASAILSRMLSPRTCRDSTSLGLCSSGAARISAARCASLAAYRALSRTASAAVRGSCGAGACTPGLVAVPVMGPPLSLDARPGGGAAGGRFRTS